MVRAGVTVYSGPKRGRIRRSGYEAACTSCVSESGYGQSRDGSVIAWGPDATRRVEATCQHCGLPVLLAQDKRRKVPTCSDACRAKHYAEKKRVSPVTLQCDGCGTDMLGRADRKFCSAACRQRAHRRRHAGERGDAHVAPAASPEPDRYVFTPEPRRGGRKRQHLKTIRNLNEALIGLASAAASITELDDSMTPTASRPVADEMRESLVNLQRIAQLLDERAGG